MGVPLFSRRILHPQSHLSYTTHVDIPLCPSSTWEWDIWYGDLRAGDGVHSHTATVVTTGVRIDANIAGNLNGKGHLKW